MSATSGAKESTDFSNGLTEEKLFEILARYKAYNNHAESYTWKYHCNPLNMSTTLGKVKVADKFKSDR